MKKNKYIWENDSWTSWILYSAEQAYNFSLCDDMKITKPDAL